MTAPLKLASLGLKPELLTQYESFLDSLDRLDGVPERVVQMCGLRIAAMRGSADDWLSSSAIVLEDEVIEAVRRGECEAMTEAEQAALTLAERVSFQWHELTDQEVDAVVEHFGESGCVSLMTAIAFFDTNHRLESALASQPEN
jgi:alkylhydroperoxidase family enzyme